MGEPESKAGASSARGFWTAGLLLAAAVAVTCAVFFWPGGKKEDRQQRRSASDDSDDYEWIESRQPAQDKYDLFENDPRSETPPVFNPKLIDSRPFGEPDNLWQINASSAVLSLDILEIRDADEPELMQLYPSYVAAAKAIGARGGRLLPSLNLLDGKAKQFDDGLYAALELAMVQRDGDGFAQVLELLTEIDRALSPQSEAHAWVEGAFVIAGRKTVGKLSPIWAVQTKEFIAEFDADETRSKPIGFYTWSKELQNAFRFLRYLMKDWPSRAGAPDEIAKVLAQKPALMKAYTQVLDFYAHLTNPYAQLSFAPLADAANAGKTVDQLWSSAGLPRPPGVPTAHFLPYSGTKETRLFNRLFRGGLPPDADLMFELVKAIRDGKVDLKPGEQSGWYDYQVYALETFLLPARGAEHRKLQLGKRYKERMLQAFAALITKRRETHARQAEAAKTGADWKPPRESYSPRLRVEPNPTYFLRQARAYAFLQAYLTSVLPEGSRARLRGLREGGLRAQPLFEELEWVKQFFYGLHVLSCEDLGMRPALLDGELPGAAAASKTAGDWLESWTEDADLAADTRVSVPVLFSSERRASRLWATLGVRGAKLQASYAHRPRWRPLPKPEAEDAEWQAMDWCDYANYVILVDEFSEVELKGLRVLNREELRAVCDREKTKEKIVQALSE